MVKIRLKRMGKKNRDFFRVVVIEKEKARDGMIIEEIGWYDPLIKDNAKKYSIDGERAKYWLSVGAQISDTVRSFFKMANIKYAKPIVEKKENEEKKRKNKKGRRKSVRSIIRKELKKKPKVQPVEKKEEAKPEEKKA